MDNAADNVYHGNEDEMYESEDYDSSSDEEHDASTVSTIKKVPPRGITRLSRFRNKFTKPGASKLKVDFDSMGRLIGDHSAVFVSFIGDMVREHIGLKIFTWKKVDSESRAKLWDEITASFTWKITSL